MAPHMIIGRNLANERRLRTLTQLSIARTLGISRSTLQSIEAGTRRLTLLEAFILGVTYGITLSNLATDLFPCANPSHT